MFRRAFTALSLAFDDSLFVIRLDDGQPKILKGRVSGAFLSDLADLAAESDLCDGSVRGKTADGYIRLVISKEISANLQQRIRNIWQFHQPATKGNDLPPMGGGPQKARSPR